MGLPVHGQANWDDDLNNFINAVKATADSALANSNQAMSDGSYARQRSDQAYTASRGATDAGVNAVLSDPSSQSRGTLSATFGSARARENLATQTASALDHFHGKLVTTYFQTCTVIALGHSITEGVGASVLPGRRYVDRLPVRLREMLNLPAGGVGYLPARYYTGGSSQWTITAGQIYDSDINHGWGGRGYRLINGCTLQATITGTSIDVFYPTSTGLSGSFTVTVDGTLAATITQDGAQTDCAFTNVPLGASGSHTVVVAATDANNNTYFSGAYVYDGDESAGLKFIEAGHTGWASADAITNWLGANSYNQFANVVPDLVLIRYLINDWQGNVDPATSKSNLQAIIAGVRGSAPQCSFVIEVDSPADGSHTYPWSDYVDAAWAIADADTGGPGGRSGVTVVDHGKRLPAFSDGGSPWLADLAPDNRLHPNDMGHAMNAEQLLSALAPR